MNEASKKVKNKLYQQKKIYLSVIITIILGILLGIIYNLILSKSDHALISNQLNAFFDSIKKNDINYLSMLINSLIGNLSLVILIWLLGISIIGLPLIYILCFGKGFLLSFSIVSILTTYKFKGIILAVCYLIPGPIVFLLFLIFLGFSSAFFSKKLFSYLFLKQDISLRHSMKRYLQVLLVSAVVAGCCSLFDTFFMPNFLRLFLI